MSDEVAGILSSIRKIQKISKLPSIRTLLNCQDHRNWVDCQSFAQFKVLDQSLKSDYNQSGENVNLNGAELSLAHSTVKLNDNPSFPFTNKLYNSFPREDHSLVESSDGYPQTRRLSNSDFSYPNYQSTINPDYRQALPVPRMQNPKSPQDLYTPRWIRYHGAMREGRCDACEGEKWLQLKDSAYWYHKQYVHGISSTSGRPFKKPVEFRSVWNSLDSKRHGQTISLVTEGLCHECLDWIPLFKNKKRFSLIYADLDAVKESLLCDCADLESVPKIISENPLKILVGRNRDHSIYIPSAINVPKSVMLDIKSAEGGIMSGVWFKHAHCCHEYTPMA